MNYVEGTMTENGLKWLKKKKIWREVRENELLNKKIEEDRSKRKDGPWTTQKAEEDVNECFGAPRGKEGKIG
jgi:hypothetical protein